MDSAVDLWAIDQSELTNAIPTENDLMRGGPYLKERPVCPSGPRGPTLIAIPPVGSAAVCPNGIPSHHH